MLFEEGGRFWLATLETHPNCCCLVYYSDPFELLPIYSHWMLHAGCRYFCLINRDLKMRESYYLAERLVSRYLPRWPASLLKHEAGNWKKRVLITMARSCTTTSPFGSNARKAIGSFKISSLLRNFLSITTWLPVSVMWCLNEFLIYCLSSLYLTDLYVVHCRFWLIMLK